MRTPHKQSPRLRAAIANDRVTFRAPGGGVVAVGPDGQLLATADVGEKAQAVGGALVWDIKTEEIVNRFTTESRLVDLQFSPDGDSLLRLAFRAADQSVMRWDLKNGQTTPFGPEETDTANGFAVSPDGSLIAFENVNMASRTRPHRTRSPSLVSRRRRYCLPNARMGV